MPFPKLRGVKIPAPADFHGMLARPLGRNVLIKLMNRIVHLRDGAMMELVVPTIRKGGVNTVYVMVGGGIVE